MPPSGSPRTDWVDSGLRTILPRPRRPRRNWGLRLIDDAGFAPVDVGALRIARYTEPFALLVGELAYNGEGGPELA
jgi:hypothetical protein